MLNKTSEFEVQALAYWNLKNFFPIVRGEYKYNMPKEERQKIELNENDRHGKRLNARFDIVIFDSKENMKLIIEIKKNSATYKTAQARRYTRLTGVPCIYLRGMKDAENAVQIVNKYLQGSGIVIS